MSDRTFASQQRSDSNLKLHARKGRGFHQRGLAPARIVSQQVQAWALTTIIVVTPIGLLPWIAWRWLRHRNFKFALNTMLIWMTLLCVLCGLVSLAGPEATSFGDFPFDLSIPPRGLEGWDAALLPIGVWPWTICQWAAYSGHYATVAVWAVLVIVLWSFKLKVAHRKAGSSELTLRDRTGALGRSFSRPSTVLSLLALLAYLVLVPSVVRTVEQQYQQQMAFPGDPDSYWRKVDAAVQTAPKHFSCRLRSDPAA